MIYPIISYSLVFILIGGVQAALPAYSRRTIFFSVTVPERFRETADARSILRGFRRLILLWTIAAEVLALATIHTGVPWLLVAAILVLGAGTVGAYARARKQTRQFSVAPSAERTASLGAQSDGLRGSYFMLAVAVLPFFAATLFARSRWNQIPDTVALSTAFGVSGSVDVVLLLLAASDSPWVTPRQSDAIRKFDSIDRVHAGEQRCSRYIHSLAMDRAIRAILGTSVFVWRIAFPRRHGCLGPAQRIAIAR